MLKKKCFVGWVHTRQDIMNECIREMDIVTSIIEMVKSCLGELVMWGKNL